jgi:hypothetical protein
MAFGEIKQPTSSNLGGLTKTDLKDRLCVIRLTKVEQAVETKYGTSMRADAAVLVVDGALAGTVDEDFSAFGNLASQMDRIGLGSTSLARVIHGTSGTKTFWGLDFDLRDGDLEAAEAAVASFKAEQGPVTLKASL